MHCLQTYKESRTPSGALGLEVPGHRQEQLMLYLDCAYVDVGSPFVVPKIGATPLRMAVKELSYWPTLLLRSPDWLWGGPYHRHSPCGQIP